MSALDVLPLADAKAHLNMTSAAHDAELTGFIEAAVQVVERHVDRAISVREVVERRRIHGVALVLDVVPVVSILSVVELDGTGTWDVTRLRVERDSGLVTGTRTAPLYGDLQVTYEAGTSPVPPHYRLATAMVVGEMWEQTQRARGAGRRYGGGNADEQMQMPGGYLLTPAALQLLGHPTPGVA